MNVVLIEHAQSGRWYLFAVPVGVKLKKNDSVICETKKGESEGVCVTDSFEANDTCVEALEMLTGARVPLAPIVGKYEKIYFEKGGADNGSNE